MKLMAKMKVCVSTRRLLLLCCCFIMSTGQKVCDYNVTEGSSYTLPLGYEGSTIDPRGELRWKHNDTILVRRKNKRYFMGNAEIIDQHGSLKLTDLQKTSSGNYTAEMWTTNGAVVNSPKKSWILCVTDKVPKPSVTHICEKKTVTLTCNVSPKPHSLSFKWSENGKDVVNENKMSLTRPVDQLDTGYTCIVSNPGGSETSPPVTPRCPREPDSIFKVPLTNKVPKPSVTLTCEKNTVTLTCDVSQPQGLSFKWSENGKDVVNENKRSLTRPVDQLDTGSRYTCTVSSETSLPVTPRCPKGVFPSKKPDSILPKQLFGFDFWTVVGLFACGIALLLTLVTVTVCCCRDRRHRRRKAEEEEGFRLDPTDQHQQQQQQQQQYFR